MPKRVRVDDLIRGEKVTTWTFDTLLRNAGVDEVDLLQIDAEGYDLELLRLFRVGDRLPAIVNYEHVSLSRAERAAAVALLVQHGYDVAVSDATYDTVAYRR